VRYAASEASAETSHAKMFSHNVTAEIYSSSPLTLVSPPVNHSSDYIM